MNRVMLTGRLTRNPELRYTNNNKTVCEFTVASNRIGNENTDFITCVAFGVQAENLHKYQSQGSLIGIEGSYRVDRFQDKDGNDRYKHYVLVNNIEFLGSKKTSDTPVEEKRSDAEILKEVLDEELKNEYEEFGQQIQIVDEDLPF